MSYILFAEDDPISQALITEMLGLMGYDVRVADNGEDALEIALAERPRLLLLDVLMPRRSGLEVTRDVKRHYQEDAPYVILITALGSLQDIEQGKIYGADDYIIKPFSPETLRAKVRAAMADR